MLWLRVPPEPLLKTIRPRGAAWSARLPVTQEITGSNPVEVAWNMAWYANRQSGHDHPADGARRKIGTIPDGFRIALSAIPQGGESRQTLQRLDVLCTRAFLTPAYGVGHFLIYMQFLESDALEGR